MIEIKMAKYVKTFLLHEDLIPLHNMIVNSQKNLNWFSFAGNTVDTASITVVG